MAVRCLVIAPCSAKKQGYDADTVTPSPARVADLADPERRRQAEARLAAFARPAIEMYAGTHHRLVIEGLRRVWQQWGPETIELVMLSGGYGLLPADQVIIPYDVTFDEFDEAGFHVWVDHLRVPEEAAALVQDYDLAFYLLSGRYLAALRLPLDVPDTVQQIVLTGQDSLPLVPSRPNLHSFVAAEAAAAQRWHVKAPHVRGFLFGRLCQQIARHGPLVLEWLYYAPQDTERLFYKRTRWRPQLSLWEDRA